MGKYEPLSEFLRKHHADRIKLTFGEIERIVGFKLPKSAKEYRAWWSNNPANSVMTKAWLDAGFESEQVDMEGGKLVFRRIHGPSPSSSTGAPPSHDAISKSHPLIGWMKGTVRVTPGVDLTEAADPAWGEQSWASES
jgi:hypothetical protein